MKLKPDPHLHLFPFFIALKPDPHLSLLSPSRNALLIASIAGNLPLVQLLLSTGDCGSQICYAPPLLAGMTPLTMAARQPDNGILSEFESYLEPRAEEKALGKELLKAHRLQTMLNEVCQVHNGVTGDGHEMEVRQRDAPILALALTLIGWRSANEMQS